MRNHHHLARETFLEWRRSGSPREGPEAYRMREARATFKRALRQCRREEPRMREEALAAKQAGNDMNYFWQLANNRNKPEASLLQLHRFHSNRTTTTSRLRTFGVPAGRSKRGWRRTCRTYRNSMNMIPWW